MGNTFRVPRHEHVVGPSRSNVQTARYLRADIPRVAADDRFIAALADLARSSTPAPERSRAGKTALRGRLAAVTASVALVSVGVAFAVDQVGVEERAPVQDNDTVDPAGPSEPAERYEERDEDLAPHDLVGREHPPQGATGTGDPDDTGLGDGGVERSVPEAPAQQGQAGQAYTDVAQGKSEPEGNGPEGNADPGGAPGDTPQPADDPVNDPTNDPDAEPDDDPADPDADTDPGDAEEADADPTTERDTDAEVQDR